MKTENESSAPETKTIPVSFNKDYFSGKGRYSLPGHELSSENYAETGFPAVPTYRGMVDEEEYPLRRV